MKSFHEAHWLPWPCSFCPQRLEVPTNSIEAIRGFRHSTTLTECRSFLGLCDVFRRFAPNLSQNTAPLSKKLRKCQLQTLQRLDTDEISALQKLKARLMKPLLLAIPDSQCSYTVDIDVCNKQLGCVLLQKQLDWTDKPTGYWSCSMNDAKRAYDRTHSKFIAVFLALLQLLP